MHARVLRVCCICVLNVVKTGRGKEVEKSRKKEKKEKKKKKTNNQFLVVTCARMSVFITIRSIRTWNERGKAIKRRIIEERNGDNHRLQTDFLLPRPPGRFGIKKKTKEKSVYRF